MNAQIDHFFSLDFEAIRREHNARWEKHLSPKGASLVLFGAGRLGRLTLAGLRSAGINPLAFCDNNPALWGTSVDGLEVYSPDNAVSKFAKTALFVATVYTSAPLKAQLIAMGLNTISFPSLAWLYPNALLPHGALDLPDRYCKEAGAAYKALGLWHDKTSVEEFCGQLMWRASLDDSLLPTHLPAENTYFPADIIKLSGNECFVDCGAFDGDSIADFLKRQPQGIQQVVAVEADPLNCERLQQRIKSFPVEIQNKVRVVQGAVDRRCCKLHFEVTGTAGSAVGAGTYEVDAVRLDDILTDYAPSFIKMDVEGAELSALIGAQSVIRKHRPILAICTYHRFEDMWQIPLLLSSYCPDYHLFLRRHSDECWEQVCYAVPPERA